jgi:hypothetical protein
MDPLAELTANSVGGETFFDEFFHMECARGSSTPGVCMPGGFIHAKEFTVL